MQGHPLRSLPRLFLPEADPHETIEIPQKEYEKFRKVLRLVPGDEIAILPNDGSLIRCRLEGRRAIPIEITRPETEAKRQVTIIQALPKGERLETVLRMGTELGVSKFVVFPAIRSVVKWDPKKVLERFGRFEAILRGAAEQSFRCLLPTLEWQSSFESVLKAYPKAIVLSEFESETRTLASVLAQMEPEAELGFIIGPEGGWAPAEAAKIGDRGATMGPLVLRTDTAGLAAASLALLN